MVSLAAYLDELRGEVDRALEAILAAADVPSVLRDAMRYSVMGGGKRLRPCLTLAVAERVAGRAGFTAAAARGRALPAATAVELIHCYSLVHDDLPAMDDDVLRRGRPTTHVVYGDGMAILAGDGLLTEAFAVLARDEAPSCLRMIGVLADAAGARGMVGGQAIDLSATSASAVDAAALADMHARKTGALIRAAAVLGAMSVSADDHTVAAVERYARELGLAFQIIDDVLDVEGSTAALGKTAGKDAAAGKPTFPAIHGLAESRAMAADCVVRARRALDDADLGGHLTELAEWALRRTS